MSVASIMYIQSNGSLLRIFLSVTLVLLNPDMSCLCKQCTSRSVGFWRSQLIWICTVCHSVCEFVSTTWIKQSNLLTIRTGRGILFYSAWQRVYTLRGMDTLSEEVTLKLFSTPSEKGSTLKGKTLYWAILSQNGEMLKYRFKSD